MLIIWDRWDIPGTVPLVLRGQWDMTDSIICSWYIGQVGQYWDHPSCPKGTVGQDRQHNMIMVWDRWDITGTIPLVLR
uniref:Uncharacterized protein n=1 Tax=Amphimedon queenslandica TaxID=400682 RepID=A0A1X7USF4_AMPQE